MKTTVLAILTGVFAVMELFGIHIPDDVKVVISDNTNIVIAGLFALAAAWPKLKSAFDAAFKKDQA